LVSTGTPYGSIFRSSNTEPSTPDAASSAGYAGRSQRTMRSFWRLRAAPASGSPARASVTGVNSDGAGDHPVGLGQISMGGKIQSWGGEIDVSSTDGAGGLAARTLPRGGCHTREITGPNIGPSPVPELRVARVRAIP
jgi:hypothetical protein